VLLLGNIVGCYAIAILCSFTHSFIAVTQKDEIRKRVTSFQNFAVPLRRKGKQSFWYYQSVLFTNWCTSELS